MDSNNQMNAAINFDSKHLFTSFHTFAGIVVF